MPQIKTEIAARWSTARFFLGKARTNVFPRLAQAHASRPNLDDFKLTHRTTARLAAADPS